MKTKKNDFLLHMYIIQNIMSEDELNEYIKTFGYYPVNTETGWKRLGYFVMQNFETIIEIPDELGYKGAIRALNKYDMNSSDSRGERDYVSKIRKERAERWNSKEFPIDEIPLMRKVTKERPVFDEKGRKVMTKVEGHWGQKMEEYESWELVPTKIYSRRQVEPSKRRNAQPMFR